MRTQLTKEELSQLLYKRDEELAETKKAIEVLQSQSEIEKWAKYLEGKVSVYEKVASLVELYIRQIWEVENEGR